MAYNSAISHAGYSMATIPEKPTRSYSFTDHSAANPTTPHSGGQLDTNFDEGFTSIGQTIDWVSTSIDANGNLKTDTVGSDQLRDDVWDDLVGDAAEFQADIAAAMAAADTAIAKASEATASASAAAASASTASGQASAASASATAASTSATNAATSATAAATSATNATASANAASTSATNAANSATAAAASATTASGAAAGISTHELRYLPPASSNPTARPDTTPLQTGDLYWNTGASGEMRVYNGTAWVAAYVASGGAVASFNGRTGAVGPADADYNAGQIVVSPTVEGANRVQAALTALQTLANTKIATSISTTYGRSLLGAADAGAARTLLDAAPLSHTHTIANVTGLQTSLDAKAPLVQPLLDQPRFTRNYLISGTNLDNLRTAGQYDGENLTNAPLGTTAWFHVRVYRYSADENYVLQVATSLTSSVPASDTYMRARIAGVWQAWTRVASATDVTNLQTTLTNLINAKSVPPGTVVMFGGGTPPTGWIRCNGASVLVASYPTLLANTYCGDVNNPTAMAFFRCTNPADPFNTRSTVGTYLYTLDLRGEFVRAWDDARGIDAGRGRNTYQSAEIASHTHTATSASAGAHDHQVNFDRADATAPGSGVNVVTNIRSAGSQNNRAAMSDGAHTHTITVNATGGAETRPRNFALDYILKID